MSRHTSLLMCQYQSVIEICQSTVCQSLASSFDLKRKGEKRVDSGEGERVATKNDDCVG